MSRVHGQCDSLQKENWLSHKGECHVSGRFPGTVNVNFVPVAVANEASKTSELNYLFAVLFTNLKTINILDDFFTN